MITLTTQTVDRGQSLTTDDGTFFGMIYYNPKDRKGKPWQFTALSPLDTKMVRGPRRVALEAAKYDALAWAEGWAEIEHRLDQGE